MKNIQVSTDVFASIWAIRAEEEESEDAILRRVLNMPRLSTTHQSTSSSSVEGFHDHRYDVHFSEGFEIFRFYKGKRYSAKVTKGRWLLENNGNFYPSLHKLSRAVVSGGENSWKNWKYRTDEGGKALIDELRDQSKIQRRPSKPPITLDDF